MTRRGRAWVLAAVVATQIAACDTIRHAGRTVGELLAVRAAVQRHVGSAPVHVNLSNGTLLAVTITNSPLHVLPDDRKKVEVRELARIAYDAYPSRAALTRVSIVLAVQTNVLMFHISNGLDTHAFEAASLRGPAVARPGPS
jgi:hypothetical protein